MDVAEREGGEGGGGRFYCRCHLVLLGKRRLCLALEGIILPLRRSPCRPSGGGTAGTGLGVATSGFLNVRDRPVAGMGFGGVGGESGRAHASWLTAPRRDCWTLRSVDQGETQSRAGDRPPCRPGVWTPRRHCARCRSRLTLFVYRRSGPPPPPSLAFARVVVEAAGRRRVAATAVMRPAGRPVLAGGLFHAA